ncbi:MAG: deoxynucleoside kinase [Clostridiales bacterium]|nr:deoxynucleoside kinase [Clostridiales bacterium]
MKIAIHGGMAVGKTTLLQSLEKKYPEITYSYEDITAVVKKVKLLGLNKNEYCDYLINQDLFIKHEMKRFKSLEGSAVLMDYSSEEVVFQTLTFPKVYHPQWQMHHIKRLADQLKECYVDHILYLDANPNVLRSRKDIDSTRLRKSFDNYLHGIHILKREWFKSLDHVTFLDTTSLSKEDVLKFTINWLKELGAIKD